MEPVFTENIIVTVMDYDFLERNDRIGSVKVPYSEIKKEGKREARWYYIYGAPEGQQKGYARKMNKGLVEGSNYRGEILMEFKVEKTDTKHTMKRLPINYHKQDEDEKKSLLDDNDKENVFPEMMNYYLRADLYEGTEINDIKGITTGEICVEVHVANCYGRSQLFKVKEDNVFIEWYETLSSARDDGRHGGKDLNLSDIASFGNDGVKEHLIGPFKIPKNWRDDISIPLPDVFIYLCAKELAGTGMKQVSYYRVPMRQILSHSSGLFVCGLYGVCVFLLCLGMKVGWECGEDRLFGMI